MSVYLTCDYSLLNFHHKISICVTGEWELHKPLKKMTKIGVWWLAYIPAVVIYTMGVKCNVAYQSNQIF